MNELVQNLVEALREELKQYGEMLALLDQQQQFVMLRQTTDLLQSVASINSQAETIRAARHEREQRQRHISQQLNLPQEAGFADLVPQLPADYRPLVQALVQENNELLTRVQHRVRQNHMLLSRVVELMQRFISSLCPGVSPATYNDAGEMLANRMPARTLYDAVG